jgi:hypothetical protein
MPALATLQDSSEVGQLLVIRVTGQVPYFSNLTNQVANCRLARVTDPGESHILTLYVYPFVTLERFAQFPWNILLLVHTV